MIVSIGIGVILVLIALSIADFLTFLIDQAPPGPVLDLIIIGVLRAGFDGILEVAIGFLVISGVLLVLVD